MKKSASSTAPAGYTQLQNVLLVPFGGSCCDISGPRFRMQEPPQSQERADKPPRVPAPPERRRRRAPALTPPQPITLTSQPPPPPSASRRQLLPPPTHVILPPPASATPHSTRQQVMVVMPAVPTDTRAVRHPRSLPIEVRSVPSSGGHVPSTLEHPRGRVSSDAREATSPSDMESRSIVETQPLQPHNRLVAAAAQGLDINEEAEVAEELCRYRVRACTWYYPGMSCERAHAALGGRPAGTFLLRDSSHPQHRYALSVNTGGAISSVRIRRAEGGGGSGRYFLDTFTGGGAGGVDGAASSTPAASAPDVIGLVRCYMRDGDGSGLNKASPASPRSMDQGVSGNGGASSPTGQWVLTDGAGTIITIALTRPLVISPQQPVPDLQHLARLVVNRHRLATGNQHQYQQQRQRIPKLISNYLDLYPYEF